MQVDNIKKYVTAFVWILCTVILYIILSTLIPTIKEKNSKGIMEYPLQDFFKDNIKWIAFIPFLNMTTMGMVMYGHVEWYWVIPFIIYTIILYGVILRPLARNFKLYLTT